MLSLFLLVCLFFSFRKIHSLEYSLNHLKVLNNHNEYMSNFWYESSNKIFKKLSDLNAEANECLRLWVDTKAENKRLKQVINKCVDMPLGQGLRAELRKAIK